MFLVRGLVLLLIYLKTLSSVPDKYLAMLIFAKKDNDGIDSSTQS